MIKIDMGQDMCTMGRHECAYEMIINARTSSWFDSFESLEMVQWLM